MAIVSYVLIFCSYTFSTIKYFFPALAVYKRFALFVSVISAIILFKYLINTRMRISRGVIFTGVIMCAISVMYIATPIFVTEVSDIGMKNYLGYRLTVCGQVFPCVLMAAIASSEKNIQDSLKKLSPVVGIIFSFIAFVSAFYPENENSGGLALADNGLNYQTISYMAAYASAFMEYYILTSDSDVHFRVLKPPFVKYIAYGVIMLNAVTVLIAGGRGGFVSLILFLLFTLYLSFKLEKITAIQLFRWIFLIFILILGGYFAVKFAANSTVSTNGFSRIMGFVSGEGDESRAVLRANAIQTFKGKPIFGHGFGSVFLLLEYFSHNFFTDALVETGIVGAIIWLIVFIKFFNKGIKMIKNDVSDSLWMYIFLSGFIMSMFSGYYITHFPLDFGLVYVLTYKAKNLYYH